MYTIRHGRQKDLLLTDSSELGFDPVLSPETRKFNTKRYQIWIRLTTCFKLHSKLWQNLLLVSNHKELKVGQKTNCINYICTLKETEKIIPILDIRV